MGHPLTLPPSSGPHAFQSVAVAALTVSGAHLGTKTTGGSGGRSRWGGVLVKNLPGQERQQLESDADQEHGDGEPARREENLGQRGRIARHLAILERACHLHAREEVQRIGLAADDNDVYLRKAADQEQGRGNGDRSTALAEPRCGKSGQRQNAADKNLTDPEYRRVDAALEQEKALNPVMLGGVEVGQMMQGGKVEDGQREDCQKAAKLPRHLVGHEVLASLLTRDREREDSEGQAVEQRGSDKQRRHDGGVVRLARDEPAEDAARPCRENEPPDQG